MFKIKNIIKKISFLLLAILVMAPSFGTVNTLADPPKVTCVTGNTTYSWDLVADSTGSAGANTTAIQNALNKAKNNSQMSYITISSGKFYVNNTLEVYSNTSIEATGAEIVGTMSSMTGSLLRGRISKIRPTSHKTQKKRTIPRPLQMSSQQMVAV